jgi:hypothetical protein
MSIELNEERERARNEWRERIKNRFSSGAVKNVVHIDQRIKPIIQTPKIDATHDLPHSFDQTG